MNSSSPSPPTQHPLFQKLESSRRGKVREETITLAHGSGGKAMRDLIDDVFVNSFDNPILAQLEDQATIDLAALVAQGDRLAFTTDSYVVDPLFFSGGNIGMLAVNGTVNDLAVSGAKPLYLSCSFILEEGLPIQTLRQVVTSMKTAADDAGVTIVTGDTKVVQRGAADKLFINTAGVGVIRAGIACGAHRIQVGDAVIINGELGNHGAAILIARGELALDTEIPSDCQPLNHLVATILEACPEIRAMRDLTRGGLATVLNEFAQSARVGIQMNESSIPVRKEVQGICELLGLDPLYLANEGKLVAIAPAAAADAVVSAMRSHPAGRDSRILGHVVATSPGKVILQTRFGSQRIVDMLVGEQLPRIC
jgi:hydrogenase expression/formation protein HypE